VKTRARKRSTHGVQHGSGDDRFSRPEKGNFFAALFVKPNSADQRLVYQGPQNRKADNGLAFATKQTMIVACGKAL